MRANRNLDRRHSARVAAQHYNEKWQHLNQNLQHARSDPDVAEPGWWRLTLRGRASEVRSGLRSSTGAYGFTWDPSCSKFGRVQWWFRIDRRRRCRREFDCTSAYGGEMSGLKFYCAFAMCSRVEKTLPRYKLIRSRSD